MEYYLLALREFLQGLITGDLRYNNNRQKPI